MKRYIPLLVLFFASFVVVLPSSPAQATAAQLSSEPSSHLKRLRQACYAESVRRAVDCAGLRRLNDFCQTPYDLWPLGTIAFDRRGLLICQMPGGANYAMWMRLRTY